MSEPFLGQITMFGGNFAPRGWAFCDGQLLAISQYTALFSILGTTYGGDGRSTFGLPDLRGRVPVHEGQGPSLSARRLGQKGGTETETLSAGQIPNHAHLVNIPISEQSADQQAPANNYLAETGPHSYHDTPTPGESAAAFATGTMGGGQAHNNMPPFQVVNFIIALEGTFPSRN